MSQNRINLHCHSQLNQLLYPSCWRIAVKTACWVQRSQLWSREKGKPICVCMTALDCATPQQRPSPLLRCAAFPPRLRQIYFLFSEPVVGCTSGQAEQCGVSLLLRYSIFFFKYLCTMAGGRYLVTQSPCKREVCGFQKMVLPSDLWEVGSDTTQALRIHERFGP